MGSRPGFSFTSGVNSGKLLDLFVSQFPFFGESAPLISCSVQVAICPEDEREEGEPMRD